MLAKSFVSHALILALILAQEPSSLIAAASDFFFYAVNFPTDVSTRQLLQSAPSYLDGTHARQRRQINLPADPFFDLTAADYEGKAKKYINVVEGLVEADKIEQAKSVKKVLNSNEVDLSPLAAPKKLVNFLPSLPLDLRNQLKRLIADDGAVLSQVASARNEQQPAPITFIRATMNSGLRRR